MTSGSSSATGFRATPASRRAVSSASAEGWAPVWPGIRWPRSSLRSSPSTAAVNHDGPGGPFRAGGVGGERPKGSPNARPHREANPGQVPARAVGRAERGGGPVPAPGRVRRDQDQPAGSREDGRLGGRARERHRRDRGVQLGHEGGAHGRGGGGGGRAGTGALPAGALARFAARVAGRVSPGGGGSGTHAAQARRG